MFWALVTVFLMYCFYKEWVKPTRNEMSKVRADLRKFEQKYGNGKTSNNYPSDENDLDL